MEARDGKAWIVCDECGATFMVDAGLAFHRFKCRKCGAVIKPAKSRPQSPEAAGTPTVHDKPTSPNEPEAGGPQYIQRDPPIFPRADEDRVLDSVLLSKVVYGFGAFFIVVAAVGVFVGAVALAQSRDLFARAVCVSLILSSVAIFPTGLGALVIGHAVWHQGKQTYLLRQLCDQLMRRRGSAERGC